MESYSQGGTENKWKGLEDWLERQADRQAEYAEAETDKTIRLIHTGSMIGLLQCKRHCDGYTNDLVEKLKEEERITRREKLLSRISNFTQEENLIVGKQICNEIERVIQIVELLKEVRGIR